MRARTTSIPTCPRATRFRSTTSRWPSTDGSTFRRPMEASKRIGITRLHMEEDAGKSLHDGFADSATRTYLDLNRCGTPLVEIVSRARYPHAGRSLRIPHAAEGDPALHRRLRLQHGRRFAALRCQCECPSQRRAEVRDQGGSEKREQLPLHPRGAGVRDRAADRSDRRRRPRGAGDAPVERERRPHLLDALEGTGTRLPLLP